MKTPATAPDIEPEEPPNEDGYSRKKTTSSRRSLSKLRRELNDEDLVSPAVNKLLLDEIERLETEASEVPALRSNHHEADKKASVLEQKLASKRSIEVIHAACMAIGGVLLGVAPSANTAAMAVGICGSVLLLAGIVAKAVKL